MSNKCKRNMTEMSDSEKWSRQIKSLIRQSVTVLDHMPNTRGRTVSKGEYVDKK